MANEFSTRLRAVDQAKLIPLVRKALENNTAEVADWSYRPVGGGLTQEVGLSHGVYRFKGTARIQDITVPWSLILKTTKLSDLVVTFPLTRPTGSGRSISFRC